MKFESTTFVLASLVIANVNLASAFTIPTSTSKFSAKTLTGGRSTNPESCILKSSFSFVESEKIDLGEEFPLVETLFPGAIPYSKMLNSLANHLVDHGYDIPTTLCATSLCCDELNRPLEQALVKMFDNNYSLGGMAGCPFGGLTAFQKMKMHIPDGGKCVIVYGSHVGVDAEGNIGAVERSHKEVGGECCRSAILASEYVLGVLDGKPEAPPPTDPCDISQYFVGTMLMPHAERLKKAPDTMLELPYALYEAQTELMNRIIKEGSQYGQFPGTVAVLGGIQINTPPGSVDYFVPCNLDFYNGDGELEENLLGEYSQPNIDWVWG